MRGAGPLLALRAWMAVGFGWRVGLGWRLGLDGGWGWMAVGVGWRLGLDGGWGWMAGGFPCKPDARAREKRVAWGRSLACAAGLDGCGLGWRLDSHASPTRERGKTAMRGAGPLLALRAWMAGGVGWRLDSHASPTRERGKWPPDPDRSVRGPAPAWPTGPSARLFRRKTRRRRHGRLAACPRQSCRCRPCP